jgi:hypothetical protein
MFISCRKLAIKVARTHRTCSKLAIMIARTQLSLISCRKLAIRIAKNPTRSSYLVGNWL